MMAREIKTKHLNGLIYLRRLIMKFGIIGAAHGHITSFANTMIKNGHEFVGIYDPILNRTKIYKDKYKIPVYDKAEYLLEQGIEIVGTSAVNNIKIDVIEMCYHKGVHVIADKPAVVSKDQYDRLSKIISDGKIQIGMLLTLRFSPAYCQLKKILDQNQLGTVLSYGFHNPHNLNPDTREEWHFSSEQNGGLIIDLLIHCTDLLNWYNAGFEIESCTGIKVKSVLPEKESFYDYADVFLKSKDGISAYFKTGWLMPECSGAGGYKTIVTGSKGMAIIDENVLKVCINNQPFEQVTCEKVDGDPTTDFLKGIKGEKRIISHEDILAATKMTLEMDSGVTVHRKA